VVMLLDYIRLAFGSFSTNRMRSFLSLLGIIIGVASVIAITSLGRSATMTIQGEIARAGLGTILVQPRAGTDIALLRLFTPAFGDRLIAEIPGIDTVMPMHGSSVVVKYRDREYKADLMAVTEQLQSILDIPLDDGRFLSEQDRLKRRSVVVLGAEVAAELFPVGSAVGKHVRLQFDPVRSFEVVGVMKSRAETMRLEFDPSIFIPFETYSTRIQRITYVQSYMVGVVDETEVLNVADRIEKYFINLSGKEDSVRVRSPSEIADMFHAVTVTLNAFLTGIAAISLIVGGIGIMNIMLVSVTERTREIGIRKALGASPGAILGQFMTEAVTLSIVGGIIGMIVGTALSSFGTWLFGWDYTPNPMAYPISMLFAGSVGIFFGLYPAVRASRLNPVDALNYE
jgi:ABC-type antimicrobial peptide transport system permease subunit